MNGFNEWGVIASVVLSGVRMVLILLTHLKRTREVRSEFNTTR